MKLKLTKIRQSFPNRALPDPVAAFRKALQALERINFVNKTIGIAAGSRGINNLSLIMKELVEFLQQKGARPFIFPAMGSHGGATAEGQAELLAGYGLTEAAMGCPVRSSMEVVELENQGLENRVFMDRFAWEADGIILVNRIKPHTDYHGKYESGLCKMLVLGVGKHRQALEMHRFGVYGLRELMPLTAEKLLATGKVLAGIGIVEDAYDHTMHLEAIPAKDILQREPELLQLARENMPKLPVRNIDVLIVDELGKNISGTGMDTNIIGRMKIREEPEPDYPNIKEIIINDVTAASHGNALGIGLADLATRRIVDKIDYRVMYENVFTSTFLERAKIPVTATNVAEAMKYALRACGPIESGQERIMRIKNTLEIEILYVSAAVLNEIRGEVEVMEEVEVLDDRGELKAF
jgi:hypothetical protein